ncbi:acetolactate decarboxylase [Compostimonas suwonensis]|uniref:Alpha-acetolactate decarboxylase n=1 Tax=Compostimonas suwonensis TaxID=1048394 RepID=A0A2M9C068_9MICO|nr:acetolactate decarboxylase [Compostimonas suwonensis]PJJ63725.1 acetolactate decarboxylase [Compostimonas suwonensis]
MTTHDSFLGWARNILAHRHGGSGIHHDAERAHTVYQTSTMSALVDGIYDGDVSVAELLGHGDFGVGTFNHLDGEMVVLDGVCHHLRSDGSAHVADDTELTPFAVVTWFGAEQTFAVTEPTSKAQLVEWIDRTIVSENLFYAVRVTGSFARVHTRTAVEQHRPYPRLSEAAAGQEEMVFTEVTGTLAGFRTPDYEQGISVAGYHLHFLDSGRHRGGHMLDFVLDHGEVAICASSDLHLSLPRSGAFLHGDLAPHDLDAQIERSEG